MNTKQATTVVGVFEDRDHANGALMGLIEAGFPRDRIGIAAKEGQVGVTGADEATERSEAGEGAVAGTVAGLGLGALAGLGVVSGVIPVVGPAIAAGTLGVVVSNAAAGAGLGGLLGALIGAGLPDDEAHYYEGEFKAGRLVMTVDAGGRADDAIAVLRSHGAYDVHSHRAGKASAASASTRATYSAGETRL